MNPERPLPSNIRSFLTITKPKPRTSKTEPSSLLSRVAEFLPEIAAANKDLKPGDKSDATNDGQLKQGDVQMDIYVDNTLGELVANDKPKPLIEEIKHDKGE